MKGLAQTIRALILLVGILGCLADKSKKPLKKFPAPPFGPHVAAGGHKFLPSMHLPPIPPHQLAPISIAPKQAPNPSDPYACLPKYLCIVQNKKGEKRTTILHGLHPALRKAKPSVIDPSTFPKVAGGTKPFVPSFSSAESADDEMFRDREFNDSFLKQQEMAENMAFLEEKRRQFLYQQGHRIKSKIIPKGGEKPVEDDDTKSKESNEDEEEEKSQEVSKEEKQEEAEKSVEVSKEEEKDEPEESAEEDASSESQAQSRSQLSKYQLKKKAYASKKRNGMKSRIDDYDDSDMQDDQLATVPWDDRITNDSDPLKPKEIYDKLFRKVLPFQLPSLQKVAKSIPGMSFLASEADDEEEVTTTTTQRPGLLKRMVKVFTGSSATASTPVKKRYGKPVRRYKRDVKEGRKIDSDTAKIVKQIRDPARQCRMIYKGCELPYDHIMKMVSSGQVLIENDEEIPTTKKPAPVDPAFVQDDEAEQAVRDKIARKKSKPIPQMLAQAHLGGKKTGKNKKPVYDESDEEFSDEFQRPKAKKPVASLPLLPMRYQWGKPTYTVHGKPTYGNGPPDFSGGIIDPAIYKTPPPAPQMVPTTTTTEKPIFAAVKLDKKDDNTQFQHSVIKLNKTHAAHVLKKKPYNPPKTRTRDDKGRPVSFNTVFTEIAGNTGGIHDFFDRISGAFGGDGTRESGRELTSTFPGSNTDVHGNPEGLPNSPHAKPTAFPQSPMPDEPKEDDDDDSAERDDDDASDEEEEDDDNDQEEEADENNDQEEEADEGNEQGEANDGNAQEDEEEEDEEEKDEVADEVAAEATEDPKQTNKKKPQETSIAAEYDLESLSLDKKKKPEKENNKKKPPVPEEEEDEEEIESDNEASIDNLPDTIPPFIKQSMIEDYKKKQKEKEEGDDDDEQQDDEGPQQGGHHGRPGGPGGSTPGGSRPGGLSLGLGSLFGRPSQGGLFGSQQHGQSSQGGLFGSQQYGQGSQGGMYGSQQHGQGSQGGMYGSQQHGQGSQGGMFGSQQPGQGSQGGGGLFSFLG